MTTTTDAPRIPADMFATGTSVAVRAPRDGSLAHRPASVRRPTGRSYRGQDLYEDVTVAACAQDGAPVPLVTAHWADHMGAVACTEQACFPDATGR